MSKLANHLKTQRLKNNHTIRDIERLSKKKISDCNFNKIEKGIVKEPSPQSLRIIAHALKLDYINLLILAGYITPRELQNHKVERLLKALKRNEQ